MCILFIITSILKNANGFGVRNKTMLGKGGNIMRIQAESWAVYRKAYNAGKKNARKMTKQGTDPYLPVLADILSEDMISEKVTIGTMGIPTDRICGLATDADKERYTHDFLPLPSFCPPVDKVFTAFVTWPQREKRIIIFVLIIPLPHFFEKTKKYVKLHRIFCCQIRSDVL